jgi:hypothetical protein
MKSSKTVNWNRCDMRRLSEIGKSNIVGKVAWFSQNHLIFFDFVRLIFSCHFVSAPVGCSSNHEFVKRRLREISLRSQEYKAQIMDSKCSSSVIISLSRADALDLNLPEIEIKMLTDQIYIMVFTGEMMLR